MGLFDVTSPGDPFQPEADEWNAMRTAARLARGFTLGPGADADAYYPCTVAKVRNDSGVALSKGDAVGLGSPIITPTANLAEFKRMPSFAVTKPVAGTHENKFGILLEPLASGAIGSAAIFAILARLTGTDVGYAEIQNASTVLLASATGSARVLWAEAGSGERWALIRLGGGSSTSSTQAKKIRFTLASALTTATASVAGCTVRSYFEGTSPGGTVTVYNEAASGGAYMFSGASGNYGLAEWDDVQSKYFIYQMQCP